MAYRFGIEEEYFVTDVRTRNVRHVMSKSYFRACKKELGNSVTNEMLQSQIEVATSPCETMSEARAQLLRFRSVLAKLAARHGLAIVASGTHPLALWHEQKQTPKKRYDKVMADLQMVGFRDTLCGMHVHVEVPDPARRVEIMYRTFPFLPLLLALSTSSPFWQGYRTGLHGYRLAAYDELPRTGFPPLFKTLGEYQHYVDTLVTAQVIKDASFIWWVIRPSLQYPTLELRIADACTRLDDAICIAAIFRCLVRHLVEQTDINADLSAVGQAIAIENKWRAQRYGTAVTFVDQQSMQARPIADVLEDLLGRLADDAEALSCASEIVHAREILRRGSSADEQLKIYGNSRMEDRSRQAALKEVVDWLCHETIRGID
jgi:glutamate---cysteine ligase / carboxylate-amine ligase